MSTITAILEPDTDGTLHLPLPADMRAGKIKVEASLEPVNPAEERRTPVPGSLKGFWMSPDFDEPFEE